MRRTGVALLLAALAMAAARLCTGIVYRADEPLAALVLRAPAWAIERTETAARQMEGDIVIDSEEPNLVYGRLYLGLMHAVPVVATVIAAAGLLLLARTRRRA